MSAIDFETLAPSSSRNSDSVSTASSDLSGNFKTPPDTLHESKQDDSDRPYENVDLTSSLDGLNAEGVEVWAKLDAIRISGVDDGMWP